MKSELKEDEVPPQNLVPEIENEEEEKVDEELQKEMKKKKKKKKKRNGFYGLCK